MKNADMPAMPVRGADGEPLNLRGDLGIMWEGDAIGMTKREMMAMHFCAAMMANPKLMPADMYDPEEGPGREGVAYCQPAAYARAAVEQADALLEMLG